jgi:hypothetical protein
LINQPHEGKFKMAKADTATQPEFKDEMQAMSFRTLSGLIEERNSLVGTISAASGDRLDLVEQLTEESNEPDIVAAREARDEAIAALDALIRPKVEDIIANASEKIDEATAKVKELDSTIKPGVSYYKKMYGEDSADAFPDLKRSRSVRIGSSGTGGRRIRGFNFVVTANGDVTEFDNASAAAKHLGVEVPTFQDAFFTAAGVEKSNDADDRVVFNVTFTDVDEEGEATDIVADVTAERKAEDGE